MKTLKILEDIQVDITRYVANYGFNILGFILIIIIGIYASKKIKKVTIKFLKKSNIDVSLVSFISQIVYVLCLVFVGVSALNKLGMSTTSFIAVLGASGFAIGLAFQDSLSNFASGILILIFNPFRTNDYIQGAGTEGTVVEIQIFNTILKTPDNKTIIVPNSKLTAENIINFTFQDKRRIDFIFGISYDSDIKTAKNIIEKVFNEEEKVLKDPQPIIGVHELADSCVNIAARPWVKTEDYWEVYYKLMEKIKYEFDKNGIEIPYPQRVVYHKQVKEDKEK
ncbi:mechanosensitive ion channel family protein [Tepidibacter formicigenes]|jgi:small conductance mechanosensitive channel|uniref:Small conductance mechanosensitive channel n=1 Tax=Tepidibacter formicigenes DSM 15518 TaxID=1123349 RepID=A0A1M6QAI2_9FIRM|nr:mechanosensitive ion channel domain-containing protein [Tepidibacter formicigenes]SHK17304.1 small conductance mechanosensitive channel [Tepidibacter formicigenes DSM 15518]